MSLNLRDIIIANYDEYRTFQLLQKEMNDLEEKYYQNSAQNKEIWDHIIKLSRKLIGIRAGIQLSNNYIGEEFGKAAIYLNSKLFDRKSSSYKEIWNKLIEIYPLFVNLKFLLLNIVFDEDMYCSLIVMFGVSDECEEVLKGPLSWIEEKEIEDTIEQIENTNFFIFPDMEKERGFIEENFTDEELNNIVYENF